MRLLRLSLMLMLLACVGTDAASAEHTIPRYFEPKFGGDPLWISLSEAMTPEGALRPEIRRRNHLNSQMRQRLEQESARRKTAASDAARQPGDVCDVQYGHRFTDGPDDGVITSVAVLDELLATRLVISGTVTAAALGLHEAIPYTILQIDTDSREVVANRVFLMYPRGRVRFEGIMFCNEDPSFKDLPSIGDSIVFIASHPIDSTGTLFSTRHIVYETEAGVVASSTSLRLEPEALPKSVRAFTERMRGVQQRDQRQ
jgi:hypothetical protein